jgi:hypothetical protein
MFYGFAVGCWRQRRFDPGINLTSVPTVGILFHSSGATKKTQVVRLFSKLLEDEKIARYIQISTAAYLWLFAKTHQLPLSPLWTSKFTGGGSNRSVASSENCFQYDPISSVQWK